MFHKGGDVKWHIVHKLADIVNGEGVPIFGLGVVNSCRVLGALFLSLMARPKTSQGSLLRLISEEKAEPDISCKPSVSRNSPCAAVPEVIA